MLNHQPNTKNKEHVFYLVSCIIDSKLYITQIIIRFHKFLCFLDIEFD